MKKTTAHILGVGAGRMVLEEGEHPSLWISEPSRDLCQLEIWFPFLLLKMEK